MHLAKAMLLEVFYGSGTIEATTDAKEEQLAADYKEYMGWMDAFDEKSVTMFDYTGFLAETVSDLKSANIHVVRSSELNENIRKFHTSLQLGFCIDAIQYCTANGLVDLSKFCFDGHAEHLTPFIHYMQSPACDPETIPRIFQVPWQMHFGGRENPYYDLQRLSAFVMRWNKTPEKHRVTTKVNFKTPKQQKAGQDEPDCATLERLKRKTRNGLEFLRLCLKGGPTLKIAPTGSSVFIIPAHIPKKQKEQGPPPPASSPPPPPPPAVSPSDLD
jgi:hypothetical protein